jgi:hypothetical protein
MEQPNKKDEDLSFIFEELKHLGFVLGLYVVCVVGMMLLVSLLIF